MDHLPRPRTRHLVLLIPLTWPGVVYGLWQRRQTLWWSLPRPSVRWWWEETPRAVAGACLLLIGASLTALVVIGSEVWTSASLRVEPLPVVHIPVGPLPVPQSAIIMSLIRWTECVRSISSDTKVLGDCWETVRDFTAPRAWEALAPFYAQQLERHAKQRRVQVTLPQVALIDGSRTYRVEWKETAVEPSGTQVAEESGSWEAHLHLADFSDTAARERLNLRLDQRNYRNLLGIVVDDIQWKQRPSLNQLLPPGENPPSSIRHTGTPIIERELAQHVPLQPTVVSQ